jgi:hypothetical protein
MTFSICTDDRGVLDHGRAFLFSLHGDHPTCVYGNRAGFPWRVPKKTVLLRLGVSVPLRELA